MITIPSSTKRQLAFSREKPATILSRAVAEGHHYAFSQYVKNNKRKKSIAN